MVHMSESFLWLLNVYGLLVVQEKKTDTSVSGIRKFHPDYGAPARKMGCKSVRNIVFIREGVRRQVNTYNGQF